MAARSGPATPARSRSIFDRHWERRVLAGLPDVRPAGRWPRTSSRRHSCRCGAAARAMTRRAGASARGCSAWCAIGRSTRSGARRQGLAATSARRASPSGMAQPEQTDAEVERRDEARHDPQGARRAPSRPAPGDRARVLRRVSPTAEIADMLGLAERNGEGTDALGLTKMRLADLGDSPDGDSHVTVDRTHTAPAKHELRRRRRGLRARRARSRRGRGVQPSPGHMRRMPGRGGGLPAGG